MKTIRKILVLVPLTLAVAFAGYVVSLLSEVPEAGVIATAGGICGDDGGNPFLHGAPAPAPVTHVCLGEEVPGFEAACTAEKPIHQALNGDACLPMDRGTEDG